MNHAGTSGEHAIDAHLELMDRQVVDTAGQLLGKVDDVELEQRDDGRIVVTGLLTGPGALGPRLGGALGAITTAAWSRLSGRDPGDPRRIDISDVTEVSTTIRLAVSRESLGVDGFEVWVRDRVIRALPGQGKDPR